MKRVARLRIRGGTVDGEAPYALCERKRGEGFTLLEVMIAMAVFFIVVFAILGVVVQSLGAARSLQVHRPDAGMLAGMLTLSNCCDEGFEAGDFEDVFPNHRWERQITEVGTNTGALTLWRVDFAVFERTPSRKEVAEYMSVLMAKPPCTRRR
jgi:hypothetical protein